MTKATLINRLRYRMDTLMSRGPATLIGVLFLLSALVIIFVSLVAYLATGEGQELGFRQIIWMSLMRTLDSGTMGGDAFSGPFLAAMFIVTMGGIFVVGALIGILTTGIDSKLDELRKGRSLVLEQNHSVILGWSPQIFTIISELAAANANQKRACIAILADLDKVEMEDQIRSRVGSTGRTQIVCRTGSPMDLADLEIVNPHAARSVIILADESPDADTRTIKTLLALTNNPNRRPESYHIVAEIRDPKNMEAARLVGRQEAELILVDELIARIMAQTCRQSGLSIVYTELLDFGGDEIYFKEESRLVGMTFGEALFAYMKSTLIGLRFADGRIALNPPMETRIAPGDRVIAISEDDDTVVFSLPTGDPVDHTVLREPGDAELKPETTLILGWNRQTPALINELDHYVAPGSTLKVVAEVNGEAAEIDAVLAACSAGLRHQTLDFQNGSTTDRRTLDGLKVERFDHVITLGYSDRMDADDADARTLVSLLHLRDISERGGREFSIVSEMLDSRNRELAEVTRADDFIVSDKLISLLMSQISENKELAAVFTDLFDPDGSELYLKPAADYVALDVPVNFYTILEAARCRGEVGIGYSLKRRQGDAGKANGVVINPDKSEKVVFADEDRVIVLAEG